MIIGGNDWAAGTVTVRDLRTGDQQQVTPADAPARVRDLLERGPGTA